MKRRKTQFSLLITIINDSEQNPQGSCSNIT